MQLLCAWPTERAGAPQFPKMRMRTDASRLDCSSFTAPRFMPLQKVTSVFCATVRADSIVLQTGNARSFAMEMFEEASERGFFATCLDMEVHATATTPCLLLNRSHLLQKCTPHVLLENEVVFAICSTHIGGAPPPAAVPFFDALFDHNVPLSLKDVRFSVLGLGHSEYEENYCKVMRPRPPAAAALLITVGRRLSSWTRVWRRSAASAWLLYFLMISDFSKRYA